MEYIEWAEQLKSHAMEISSKMMESLTANLNSYQAETIYSSTTIATAYFLVLLLSIKVDRVKSLLAFLFCILVEYSPLYNHLMQVQYYSVFAIIYLSLTYLVKPIKTKAACCMLGSFQLIMAWDSYANATIETFIWTNYESIVCLLHALIIGSFLERDFERIKSILDSAIAGLRNLFGYTCNQLCLWYYYTNTNN